jgi:hypothetical protein
MMRKAIRYSAILLPVLILVFYLLKEQSPFGGKNTSFAVTPKNEITAIEFSEGNKTLKLTKKGEEWFVNERFDTRKSGILFIIKILTEMQIKSPVTPGLFNTEIIEKGISPVRVKVSEKGRTLRTFLVYKTSSNTYGNIMKLREGSKPFIVYVPGNDVEIGSAFTLNELFWQPFTLFSLLPSEILSVTFENRADTGSSFRIENRDRDFRLFGQRDELTGWDTSRIIRYISYFTHVPFERWAFDLQSDERENIKKQEPLFRITVTTAGGESNQLILWEKTFKENGMQKIDTDRLWGKKEDGDELLIVRYTDIDPLIKKRSYFFPQ